MKAIKKEQFKSWPGLTKSAVKNCLPSSMATAKGHLGRQRKKRKNARVTFQQDILLDKLIKQESKDDDVPIQRTSKRSKSTAKRNKNDPAHLQLFLANAHKQIDIERPRSPTGVANFTEHARTAAQNPEPASTHAPAPGPITYPNACDATDDLFPAKTIQETNNVFAFMCLADKIKNTICSDLTGQFPFTSAEGHKCALITCECDSNSIFAEPLRSRDNTEALRACDKIYSTLTKLGRKPVLNTMDNEASTALKRQIEKT